MEIDSRLLLRFLLTHFSLVFRISELLCYIRTDIRHSYINNANQIRLRCHIMLSVKHNIDRVPF